MALSRHPDAADAAGCLQTQADPDGAPPMPESTESGGAGHEKNTENHLNAGFAINFGVYQTSAVNNE